ncbi:DUF2878 domain-containing protein [Microbulbifer sp. Q7]|uniref:DUF2878 domain-containing protein n=1 Tax=Microbulbifer sp. Q7 TaxID=1785091 RepID=UPI000A4E0B2C|nr:DUF2878 domain-containing protein [Microbulbifer sp. Q7]
MANSQSRSLSIGKLFFSGLVFEGVWLVCVLSPGVTVLAAVTLANLLIHLWLFDLQAAPGERTSSVVRTLLWVALVALSGAAMDALLFHFGQFATSAEFRFLPLWLAFLWVNFSLALRFAFRFLQRNLWVAALFGATGGPLSYWVGAKINGDVILGQPIMATVLLLALLWAVYLPVLMACARSSVFSGSLVFRKAGFPQR